MTVGLINIVGPRVSYEGLVAFRSRQLTTSNNNFTQIMGRYALVASENLTDVCVGVSNYLSSPYDVGGGLLTTSTLTASIEYPANTFNQLKFNNGANSVSIPNGTAKLSDYVHLSTPIPAGATFWVRQFVTNANGVLFFYGQNPFYGEATTVAVSGLADQTMSGTIPNTFNPAGVYAGLPPQGVYAMTKNPSVIIVGDSIARGVGDIESSSADATGYDGKVGLVARSLGARNIPFLNLSLDGETANTWPTKATARGAFVQKGSHMIIQLGVNDLDNISNTPAGVVSSLQAIAALKWSKQKVWKTTITPHVTSGSNNTPVNAANHNSLNDLIRAGIAGIDYVADVNSILEASVNSDTWTNLAYTSDGLHGSVAGYANVASSSVFSGIVWP